VSVPRKADLPDVTNIDLDRLYDRYTAAAFLGISVRTLDLWIRQGKIPVVRPTQRSPRFNLRRIQQALERFEVKEVA
jgi:excisionase family DNA binding protein